MSLKTTKKEERVFYFSETPSDINYPYPECFYFKVQEYKTDEKNNEIEHVIINKINLVFDIVNSDYIFKFTAPYIPKSIEKSVREMEKL
jgi:hypothetical protein